MPSRHVLSFVGLDDYVYKTKVSETITTASKTTVVTKSGQVRVNTDKQSSPRAAASISTVRPVNTAVPKPKVNDALPTTYSYFKGHSPVKRAFKQKSAAKIYNLNKNVKTARVNNVTTIRLKVVVSADVGNGENVVKQTQDQGIFDSGCSRHMTGNKSFLTDYQEIDGGFVAFRGSPKGGKIIGKGKIRTRKLYFEDVYFVKELKFNLFSISQMCDKKNSVLFTETECLVLSPNFKLLDESQGRGQIGTLILIYYKLYGIMLQVNAGIKLIEMKYQGLLMMLVKKTNEELANEGERNGQEKEGGALNKENDQNVQDFRAELDNLLIQQKEVGCSRNKDNKRGIVVSNKARLVAQGYTQEEGIDYDEVFAPVDGIEAIRLSLSSLVYKDVFYVVDFEQMMHKRFQMSSMRELTFFLGLQVQQKEDGIFISQDKYVADILKKFDFTTMRQSYDTQPDIMFVVCACARFQVTPKTSHLYVVKMIFRYLKGQPKLGLWYPRDSPFDLEAFSDSDYAGASLDRKSTTRAEYVAAANCCGQVLWIQNQMLVYEFNFMNTEIHIDNESTICIVKNPVFHSKTKHIKIRHHFIRDSLYGAMFYKGVGRPYLKGLHYCSSFEASRQWVHNRIQSMATLNESLPYGTDSGSGPRVKDQQQETEVPQPSSPTYTNVADEAAFTSVDVVHGGAATTISSIDARQDSGNIPKSPTMPHDSPLPGGHIPGSDEGSMTLHELTVLCTKLSNKVDNLETELKQTKQTYSAALTKIIKKVKKLEQNVKTSQARRRAKIVVSDDEESSEDPSKQGRMIEDIDQDARISLVTPTKVSSQEEPNLKFS
ncbi:putative ribonuclease H-like domain-containing protein [Tanacetum coccineum]|uniref:Ribonuclease H-like domain-containing protein n=1 Tax=Tanacetum coccineum TaxID=301880 RepID=A0ABQ5GEC7_9ASTR